MHTGFPNKFASTFQRTRPPSTFFYAPPCLVHSLTSPSAARDQCHLINPPSSPPAPPRPTASDHPHDTRGPHRRVVRCNTPALFAFFLPPPSHLEPALSTFPLERKPKRTRPSLTAPFPNPGTLRCGIPTHLPPFQPDTSASNTEISPSVTQLPFSSPGIKNPDLCPRLDLPRGGRPPDPPCFVKRRELR